MSREKAAVVDDGLLAAWKRTLPGYLGPGDHVTVRKDGTDDHSLAITIEVAGRSGYSFDFKCTYLDEREVRVELVDAEKGDRQADERSERTQELIGDIVRHIHECAQALHSVTNA